MRTRLNPYIGFGGNAREAMTFYKGIFGGELDLTTFAEGQAPDAADKPDRIMHAMLTVNDSFVLMGADMSDGQVASDISLSLSGDDESQLRGYFDGLCAGGDATMPMEKAPWGDTFGMCTDKYGVKWMVNVTASRA